jgi:exodeoxyribonuclease VII large subunit
VGHERDWTSADLAADRRAATASNAAELVVPDKSEILGLIDNFERTLMRGISAKLEDGNSRLNDFINLLVRGPEKWRDRYESAIRRLRAGLVNFRTIIRLNSDRLDNYIKTIRALSPQATLERGYSITRDADGVLVKDINSLKPGDRLQTRLASGSIISETKKTYDQ